MSYISVYGWRTEDDFYNGENSNTAIHIERLPVKGNWKSAVKNLVKRKSSKFYHIEVSDPNGKPVEYR